MSLLCDVDDAGAVIGMVFSVVHGVGADGAHMIAAG